jgi:hypothetical protein
MNANHISLEEPNEINYFFISSLKHLLEGSSSFCVGVQVGLDEQRSSRTQSVLGYIQSEEGSRRAEENKKGKVD